MSLNWKEIDLILEEMDLEGAQIQKVIQSAFDVLAFRIYGRQGVKTVLVSLSPGACRLHETSGAVPKPERPLRFAEFLNSKIVNGRIEEAVQIGDNRIVRLRVRRENERFFIYIRLWSNAANVIVTGENGAILDAMRRQPKKGEVSGGVYAPEGGLTAAGKEYRIRELPGEGSFNEKIDAFYREEGGALSLESLREQARRNYEGSIGRLKASLEKLRAKEADYAGAGRFREYGDIILANLGAVKSGASWLEAENFYSSGELVRIKLDPEKTPQAAAEDYYEQYRKAKSGLDELRIEIESGEKELARLEDTLARLLAETNPLNLNKLLKSGGRQVPAARKEDSRRPGLSFRRRDWLIIVGRDASENDALLRRHVKGNDLWLHARDYAGSYVFIKQQAGKTVPLDILLDAGNLAVFYSKGRNNGEGDLFYTQVKYLRRAKDGPKGLVLPTQEKNLHIRVEASRLRELEACRIEK
jgi:predicted ribosome quality control (RQC) complex YloA/Tae2 family protein